MSKITFIKIRQHPQNNLVKFLEWEIKNLSRQDQVKLISNMNWFIGFSSNWKAPITHSLVRALMKAINRERYERNFFVLWKLWNKQHKLQFDGSLYRDWYLKINYMKSCFMAAYKCVYISLLLASFSHSLTHSLSRDRSSHK